MADTNPAPDVAGLIRGIAAGEAGALRRLYEAQASRLFGIAMAILRDRDAAADALHDTVLKIAARAGGFDPLRGEASAWLGTIARNLRRGGRGGDVLDVGRPPDARVLGAAVTPSGGIHPPVPGGHAMIEATAPKPRFI